MEILNSSEQLMACLKSFSNSSQKHIFGQPTAVRQSYIIRHN